MESDQLHNENKIDIDEQIKLAQLKKLESEITKIEQETKELRKHWFLKQVTFENILKAFLGLGAVVWIVTVVVGPMHALQEKQLLSQRLDIENEKKAVDKQLKSGQDELKKISDLMRAYKDSIRIYKRISSIEKIKSVSAEQRTAAITKTLTDIKRDSINRTSYSTRLHNSVEGYRQCIYNAFTSYLNYIKNNQSYQNQAMMVAEIGISIKQTEQIRKKAVSCKKELIENVYELNEVKEDQLIVQAIDSTESKVDKFFKNIARAVVVNFMYNSLGSDFDMELQDDFNNLEKVISERKEKRGKRIH